MRTGINGNWTAKKLAEYLGGEWLVAPEDVDWRAAYFVNHGSESNQSKDWPVSIIQNIPERLATSSIAFIVSEKNKDVFFQKFTSDPRPVLCVADIKDTLFLLAKAGRNNFSGKLISTTVSVGKLSTKDMVSELLKKVGTVKHTLGSQNTLSGVQSVLASCVTKPDYAVIEIGSHVLEGRLTRTRELVAPNISIITQVFMANANELELHPDGERGVALSKAKIYEFMQPGGIAIMNREMSHFERVHAFALKQGVTPVTYGLSSSIGKGDADVWILDICEDGDGKSGSIVRVNIYGEKFSFKIPFYGIGMALNSLAALTCIYHLGLNVKEAASYFASLTGSYHHQASVDVTLEDDATATIIDDSFNAQPLSVLEAISVLKAKKMKPDGRKIAILGDVAVYKDPKYAAGYFSFVMPLQKANFDKVYFVGKDIQRLAEVLPPKQVGGIFDTPKDAIEIIAAEIRPQDIVLVKVTSAGAAENNMAQNLIRCLNDRVN